MQGLPLLRSIISVENHDELVSTMQQHIVRSYLSFGSVTGVMGETQQSSRCENSPNRHHTLQEERAALLFSGDGAPDAPPLAWTILWRETYSALYGHFIPDSLRRCGYVFWDAATLEKCDGLEGVKEEFEDCDPRDDFP
jgi:hypothetical protein